MRFGMFTSYPPKYFLKVFSENISSIHYTFIPFFYTKKKHRSCFQYYYSTLQLLKTRQAQPFCNAVEFIERIKFDYNLSFPAVFLSFDAYLCAKLAA